MGYCGIMEVLSAGQAIGAEKSPGCGWHFCFLKNKLSAWYARDDGGGRLYIDEGNV